MPSRFVESYLSRYPLQAAEALEQMEPDAAAEMLEGLDSDELVALIAAMLPQRAAELLPEMEPAQAAAVLGGIGFVAARRLILRLDAVRRAPILAAVASPLRHGLERALAFPEGCVGRHMLTRFDCFRVRDSVRRVSADLGRNEQPLPLCFVVDEAGQVAGRVRVTDLIGADGTASIADFMKPCNDILSAYAPLAAAREAVLAEGVDYLPVGDRDRHLIGVLGQADFLRASAAAGAAADVPELITLWLGVASLFWQVGARMLIRSKEPRVLHEADER
ncbi:MAG: CBS domain-containing protein [Gammaproteobacteria bacterium]